MGIRAFPVVRNAVKRVRDLSRCDWTILCFAYNTWLYIEVDVGSWV